MKRLLMICALGITIAAVGCSSEGSGQNDDKDTPAVENKFPTPEAALEQTKKNLHLILNDNQKRKFGLTIEADIKALAKVTEMPVSYLAMDKLADTAVALNDDGYLYGLGKGQASNICISVSKGKDGWMQNTVGLNMLVKATNSRPGATRLVEVPGLEVSFLEHGDSTGKVYTAIKDYPDAGISQRMQYRQADMLRVLENYRQMMEKKYGADFSNGNLEK